MSNPPSQDSADRRTELAADRNVFAAERTYAAWVRTGLAALASGVGAQTLLEGALPEWSVRIVGSMLILFSAFAFVAAVWREARPGLPPPKSDVPRLSPWLLVGINAFLVLVALCALVGVWLGKAVTG